MRHKKAYFIFLLVLALPIQKLIAQDSSKLLKKITVNALKKKNTFTAVTPSQTLGSETLQQINAATVGDAARFFSGVQVKDYGGAGGLKTVSVRSLGASHTGINYDGVPVSNAQSGQIDLGRYSNTFLYSIDLFQANIPGTLLPARTFSAASVLSISTQSYYPSVAGRKSWKAGTRAGSFGLIQAFAGTNFSLGRKLFIGLNAEAISSKGDYPITIVNGNLSEKTRRNNSKLRSVQGEVNILKIFHDSSTLQVKGWSYASRRGLPGAIIFFNDRSVQQLWNRDYFIQSRYHKDLSGRTSFLAIGKFNHTYTRYTDPDFLNNAGGLDQRYRQSEYYASLALNHRVGNYFTAGIASDIAYANLKANTTSFAFPTRISTWNNAVLNYSDSLWQAGTSLLWSRFTDKTKTTTASHRRDKLTPAFAVSRKLTMHSPFMLRAFYKHVFRMPTFNDLYYNFIGNNNLRPEYAQQYNLGIVYSKRFNKSIQQFNISVDGYYNLVKDKIVAVPGQNLFTWTMLNLGKVQVKGVDVTGELAGLIRSGIKWSARVSYTWQQVLDITDASASNYRDRIPYTPDHSGSGMLSVGIRKWTAGGSFNFSGTRYGLGDNSPYTQLDGWGTGDLFVLRQVDFNHFTGNVKLELNNITGQRYDIIQSYPMPGRSFKIGITFNNL